MKLRSFRLLACLCVLSATSPAAIYTVTSVSDGGPGSLRQALLDSNANPGPDTIRFNIPGAGVQIIQLGSVLDPITDPVIIDGYTQPGASPNTLAAADNANLLIELDGSLVASANGLTISSGSCLVRGLIIGGFFYGIALANGGHNEIQGNFIGIAANGSDTNWAGLHTENAGGIFISDSADNVIGGANPALRNVISGNGTHEFPRNGITILGSNSKSNVVQGNFIGLTQTGDAALQNSPHGVRIQDGSYNLIGGTEAGQRNVISGNNRDGVEITGSSAVGNQVTGNYIGTAASGVTTSPALGNQQNGVTVTDAPGNIIGDDLPNPANLIAPKNVISGNRNDGILLNNTVGCRVEGNFIGTDASGTVALPNALAGLAATGSARNNVIGGATPAAGNLISGNGAVGIELSATSPLGNTVQGNRIGTDVRGRTALGNGGNGVWIVDSPNNLIGGLNGLVGNLISGNQSNGVAIARPNATGNVIEGNQIGTDAAATNAVANLASGVAIADAANNRIGGTGTAAANWISGNAGSGIDLRSAAGTTVQVNFVGVDRTISAALGNGGSGIFVDALSSANVIGGARAGNVFSGNRGAGVDIHGSQNVVYGNFIGTDFTGTTALGNCFGGVFLYTSALDNSIGGGLAGQGNIIAYNDGPCHLLPPFANGVEVCGPGSTGNSIRFNAIYKNAGLGIDLCPRGVTLNDPGGPHTGPNQLQNFPVLSSATNSLGVLRVEGDLNSTPSTTFLLDFYASRECDLSGYGEGERHVGTGSLTTDAAGNAHFLYLFSTNVTHFTNITATATDPGNNTSEFSACRTLQITNHPPIARCKDLRATVSGTCEIGLSLSEAIARINNGSFDPDGDPITFSLDPPPPYPVGTTSVTLTVTDDLGASSSCTARVLVLDLEAPVVTCPADMVLAASPGACSAIVNYPLPAATDNCPGVTVLCVPASASLFPVGVTKVNCVATDASGNTAACSFLVTVTGDVACGGAFDVSGALGPNGSVALTVITAFPGLHYIVKETVDLASPQWLDLPNVVFTGQGTRLQALVFPSGSPRFYRVVASPQ
jgi:hypothetical protein